MEVREQHAGVDSFYHVGHRYQIQVVKLGYKSLTTDPSCYISRKNACLIFSASWLKD